MYIPQSAKQVVLEGAQSQAAWAIAMKRAKQSVVVIRENFMDERYQKKRVEMMMLMLVSVWCLFI